ncbi:MAG TPA: hypothetical protein VLX68_17035 [Chitinivibrionales bacterium]|nr:hypothetical protein [Chitinivibrionales bacterium]
MIHINRPIIPAFLIITSIFFQQSPAATALSKLLGSSSQKRLVETAADHAGSLLFKKAAGDTDVIHVIGIRVEFKSDTNPLTTGNGLFGMQGDAAEQGYYNSDTVYKFDALGHKLAYFNDQFEFVKRYFSTVSRGKLRIDYTVYPTSDNVPMYAVSNPMSVYSPGYKPPQETYDDYYERKTVGLMKFIVDAIKSADKNDGPFAGLSMSNGNIVDSLGHKTVFMILHAGSSFLTDGGAQGSIARNSPSDMIDVFVSNQFFHFFKDTIKLDSAGVMVSGAGGAGLLVDEVMMCSETSNQDGLNFGIHGIMVNQIARQIGIPDLFSTSSGMTAVGSFCIMDPYGYSAANGFIPPWPSAWVRAYMGWDAPVPLRQGQAGSARCKAVSAAHPGDTTILLVPINDHEYYLIENRQRNLSGDTTVFNWDIGKGPPDTAVIDQYEPVNLQSRTVVDSVSNDGSRVILSAKNYDVGIPASGLLVWHIDENIIRDRLKYDMLNADSNYKAVCLEEADGINDLGIMGRDIFYQPVFDFGGAEDVFPHFTKKTSDSTFVYKMNEWTKPSTHANDGGQTFLAMRFDTLPVSGAALIRQRKEFYRIYDHWVRDFSDSAFTVSVNWDLLVPGWPKHTVPEKLFDPAVFGTTSKKLALVSQSGRLYVWPAGKGRVIQNGDSAVVSYVNVRNVSGSTTPATAPVTSETVHFDTIPGAYTFPTVINGKLIVPSRQKRFYLVTSASDSTIAIDSTPQFPWMPSTYLCKLPGNSWVMGCSTGVVLIGDTAQYSAPKDSIRLAGAVPVSAVAALPGFSDSFVCIQNNSILSLLRIGSPAPVLSAHVDSGIPPYSLVTADLNKDNKPEIVVCDSRKGLWVYTTDLVPAPGWSNLPNDWASALDTSRARSMLPINLAPPSIADVNGDGYPDIIAGGTSGVYALNYKGVPLAGWPAVLDNRFWRGNIACSPVVTRSAAATPGPLVMFNSATGENDTWEIDSIIRVDRSTGKVVYLRQDGSKDSLVGVSAGFIDSALVFGDSLVLPIVLPGGYVDALDKNGKRPLNTIGANQILSYWPLTVGGPGATSPLLDDLDNDGLINLVSVARNGWVYRWKLGNGVIGDTIVWQQLGYNGSRPFAYLGSSPQIGPADNRPIVFYSYPNPTNGSKYVVFKYKFSAPARDVRLDIFTIGGLHVLSKTGISGSFPDYNELPQLSLETFGPGIYRCRLEAVVGGTKYTNTWKMAVVK